MKPRALGHLHQPPTPRRRAPRGPVITPAATRSSRAPTCSHLEGDPPGPLRAQGLCYCPFKEPESPEPCATSSRRTAPPFPHNNNTQAQDPAPPAHFTDWPGPPHRVALSRGPPPRPGPHGSYDNACRQPEAVTVSPGVAASTKPRRSRVETAEVTSPLCHPGRGLAAQSPAVRPGGASAGPGAPASARESPPAPGSRPAPRAPARASRPAPT